MSALQMTLTFAYINISKMPEPTSHLLVSIIAIYWYIMNILHTLITQ